MFAMISAYLAELIQDTRLLNPIHFMVTLNDSLYILFSRYRTHFSPLFLGKGNYESTNRFQISFGNI